VSKSRNTPPIIRTILVPIDFQEPSMYALRYAIRLARQLDAALAVAHVYHVPAYSFLDGTFVAPPQLASQIAESAQKSLDVAVQACREGHVHAMGILRNGIPWEEICLLASEHHADLIIMGTHGRQGMLRALLGSVAENVLRTSPIPVLTLHPSSAVRASAGTPPARESIRHAR
jgi:nucleotide-binding universal stress UspA family protein